MIRVRCTSLNQRFVSEDQPDVLEALVVAEVIRCPFQKSTSSVLGSLIHSLADLVPPHSV